MPFIEVKTICVDFSVGATFSIYPVLPLRSFRVSRLRNSIRLDHNGVKKAILVTQEHLVPKIKLSYDIRVVSVLIDLR
jgi:hypothetical protein